VRGIAAVRKLKSKKTERQCPVFWIWCLVKKIKKEVWRTSSRTAAGKDKVRNVLFFVISCVMIVLMSEPVPTSEQNN